MLDKKHAKKLTIYRKTMNDIKWSIKILSIMCEYG